MHHSKDSDSISSKIHLMKYLWGMSITGWVIVAIVMTLVWSNSYEAGFEKCTSQTAQASDMDVQKLIDDLNAGRI